MSIFNKFWPIARTRRPFTTLHFYTLGSSHRLASSFLGLFKLSVTLIPFSVFARDYVPCPWLSGMLSSVILHSPVSWVMAGYDGTYIDEKHIALLPRHQTPSLPILVEHIIPPKFSCYLLDDFDSKLQIMFRDFRAIAILHYIS